jgi:hypothetical protein
MTFFEQYATVMGIFLSLYTLRIWRVGKAWIKLIKQEREFIRHDPRFIAYCYEHCWDIEDIVIWSSTFPETKALFLCFIPVSYFVKKMGTLEDYYSIGKEN